MASAQPISTIRVEGHPRPMPLSNALAASMSGSRGSMSNALGCASVRECPPSREPRTPIGQRAPSRSIILIEVEIEFSHNGNRGRLACHAIAIVGVCSAFIGF